MNANILGHLQKIACKTNDHFNREQEKRAKRKLITRTDYIFAGLLAVIAIVLLSAPLSGSAASSSTPSAYKGETSRVAITMGKGKGGITNLPPPQCPAQVGAAGPCLPQPPSVTNPQPSQPSVSPPPPVDPVGVINNWNGKSLASTTYVGGGTGADWMIQMQGGGASGAAFQTNPDYTVNQPSIQAIWRSMIAVVGGCLTILFMLTGYRIMGGAAGIRYANALEALPRVLLAGLAAFLSIIFVGFIIGLENGICQQVVHDTLGAAHGLQYTDILIPAGNWLGNIGAFFGAIVVIILGAILVAIPFFGWVIGGIAVAISSALLINYTQGFILSILAIIFALQLIARLVMIDIYIVLSPLAIGCWALPGQIGQSVTRQWASGFLSLVFVQLVQVICLSVGLLLFKKAAADFASDLFNFVGPIAVMWLVVRIPRLFGSSAVGTVASAGQTVTGAAAAITTAAAMAL